MLKYFCIFLLLLTGGCESNYYSSSASSGYSNYVVYRGVSSHRKWTTGTSNLANGYKDGPVLDPNDLTAKYAFRESAKDYLDGVVNDLKEVEQNMDYAVQNMEAAIRFANSGFEFGPAYPVRPIIIRTESNLDILGYPEFPDLALGPFPYPRKPDKPFSNDRLSITLYNSDVDRYRKQMADLTATAKDYVEDAEHYIENCKNDYEEIREKGLNLLKHIETSGMDSEVDL
jgi:hypothetical protein